MSCVPDGCSAPSNNIEDQFLRSQIKGCRLAHVMPNQHVHDLKTESIKVQNALVTYMNRLIGELGVTGFRLAHARNVPSPDIQLIVDRLQDVGLNQKPFICHDVLDYSKGLDYDPIRNNEYTHIGRIEEVRVGERLTQMWRGENNRSLADLVYWTEDFESADNSVVFIDDPFILRNVHGRGRDAVASHRERREYETLTALLLALPVTGLPRVLSTYTWPESIVGDVDINAEMPPPLQPPNINPNGDGCDPGTYGLTCEHRWSALRNMYIFHGLDTLLNPNITHFWTNGYQQAAFSRGDGAFVAINNDGVGLVERLQTTMPAGDYCDLMTGPDRDCVGSGSRIITVDDQGFADIDIPAGDPNPMIVIRGLILPF